MPNTIISVYLEEAAALLSLWLWTDGLTDKELSPSSSFCRSSEEASVTIKSLIHKMTKQAQTLHALVLLYLQHFIRQ